MKSIVGKPANFVNPPDENIPLEVWRVDDFEGLISNHGYDAYIDKAMRCPCVDKTTGQASSGCKNCLGRGWFFISRLRTKVVSQRMNNKKKFQDWGETNMGTSSITVRGSDKVGFMDRITLLELEAYYTEILKPVFFSSEIIAYPIYEPLVITDAFLFISDDEKLKPLIQGKDYKIEENKIIFDPGIGSEVISNDINEKNQDIKVTIRYSYNPVYHVLEINRELMKVKDVKSGVFGESNKVDMPINAICKKAHYLFGQQLFTEELLDNNT